MADLPDTANRSAGDLLPGNCEIIEVHVAELKQLFNAIDPSPFREKDLDPKAEEFIVSWARDAPRDAQLAFVVYLDRPAGLAEEPVILKEAIHRFFAERRGSTLRRLRHLFQVGRTSLLIGITFLAGSLVLGNFLAKALPGHGLGDIVRESLLIGGWVAMWRPLEIFLYDWWPIRAEARLFGRLMDMPVRIAYTLDASSEAWRWDWPAVPVTDRTPTPPAVQSPAGNLGSISRPASVAPTTGVSPPGRQERGAK